MTSRVCTCGANEEQEPGVVGLPESDVLARLAEQAGFSLREAARLLRAIVGAPKEDADAIVAWMVREQLRLLRVAKAKSEARAAAIEAARLRSGE